MARFCGNCGSPLLDGVIFCGECGTGVAPQAAGTIAAQTPQPPAGSAHRPSLAAQHRLLPPRLSHHLPAHRLPRLFPADSGPRLRLKRRPILHHSRPSGVLCRRHLCRRRLRLSRGLYSSTACVELCVGIPRAIPRSATTCLSGWSCRFSVRGFSACRESLCGRRIRRVARLAADVGVSAKAGARGRIHSCIAGERTQRLYEDAGVDDPVHLPRSPPLRARPRWTNPATWRRLAHLRCRWPRAGFTCYWPGIRISITCSTTP